MLENVNGLEPGDAAPELLAVVELCDAVAELLLLLRFRAKLLAEPRTFFSITCTDFDPLPLLDEDDSCTEISDSSLEKLPVSSDRLKLADGADPPPAVVPSAMVVVEIVNENVIDADRYAKYSPDADTDVPLPPMGSFLGARVIEDAVVDGALDDVLVA